MPKDLELLPERLAICKLCDLADYTSVTGLRFLACSDEEISLVCEEERTPAACMEKSTGWRAVRFAGQMDFSLTGVLSHIAAVLAAERISIFAVSTYDTDYVLLRREQLKEALQALEQNGYRIRSRS